MSRLYIGNLPFDVVERDVEALFAGVAPVRALTLIRDRFTGRGRGFGFADIDAEHARQVLAALNGTTLKGRRLKVEPAKPAPQPQRDDSARRVSRRKPPSRAPRHPGPGKHHERSVLALPGKRSDHSDASP